MVYRFYVLRREVPARKVRVEGFPFLVDVEAETLYLKASNPRNPWTPDVFEAHRFETLKECRQAMVMAIFHGPCRVSKYLPTACTLEAIR